MTKILETLEVQIDHLQRGRFVVPDDEPQMLRILYGQVSGLLELAANEGLVDRRQLVENGSWHDDNPNIEQLRSVFGHVRKRVKQRRHIENSPHRPML